jgi:quinol-cytochrome oxidoreductase complex cytochrome b subunit
LVRLHIFRLVGAFFIIGWFYEALPKSFALIGGIGDIFVALTAIFVAKLIDKKANKYKKITLIWNIIGFWDIVSVIVSAVYITKQSIETNTPGILEITKFPFCLIPAFAPATILFLHICIFKKLKMEK